MQLLAPLSGCEPLTSTDWEVPSSPPRPGDSHLRHASQGDQQFSSGMPPGWSLALARSVLHPPYCKRLSNKPPLIGALLTTCAPGTKNFLGPGGENHGKYFSDTVASTNRSALCGSQSKPVTGTKPAAAPGRSWPVAVDRTQNPALAAVDGVDATEHRAQAHGQRTAK